MSDYDPTNVPEDRSEPIPDGYICAECGQWAASGDSVCEDCEEEKGKE